MVASDEPSRSSLGERGYASPFDDLVGARVVEASRERVLVEAPVTSALHQPTGVVHGGLYATVVETAASIGANLSLAGPDGLFSGSALAVGVSNTTDFLRGVRDGRLTAEATPLQRGRTLQLWQVAVRDDDGRLVAHGKVKLANVPRHPGGAG